MHSDGAIWFSDPGYGIMSNYEGHKATFEVPANVYRLDPKTREATVVIGDLDKPNGLCFSPDEKLLYVVDTGAPKHPKDPHQIRVYDVVDGARLKNGRMFVDMSPGSSDGIRCDVDGNVWSAAGWVPKITMVYTSSLPTARSSAKFICPKSCAKSVSAGPRKTGCSWRRASLFMPCTWEPRARSYPDTALAGACRRIGCIRVSILENFTE